MKNWKVEIRDNCIICGGELPNARFRTYCSKKCRIKNYNDKATKTGYSANWQREKRNKLSEATYGEHLEDIKQ
jgi:hypothetical protein